MKRFWEYIDWVHKNPEKTNDYIKLAVKRFETDYKRKDWDYVFDETRAQKFIRFTELLKQYKDQWAGVPIHLEPWQVFIFGNIYGWVHKNTGLRRFRKAFVFVARKNGKSTMMSSVLLWDILATPGAEGYCAATKREQSKIVFNSIKEMIRQNDICSKRLTIYNSTSHIVNKANGGKIEALSADSDKMDGLNPSAVVVDEVAAMKDYNTIKVLQSGMGSRPEPLMFEITSGSDDMSSAGHQEYARSQKILEGSIEDDSYFCVLYSLDKGDDWKDEKCWIKANPNLGISVRVDTMHKLALEAQQNPMLEGEFRIKNLCQFLSPITAWIPYQRWLPCIENAKKHSLIYDSTSCVCIGAVDLSKRIDFTTYTLYIYDSKSSMYYAKHRFYIPEEQIEDKCKHDSPLVRTWIEQGYITATRGSVVDYETMFEDIRSDLEEYNISEIVYDPWNAATLINEIGPLVDLVEITQNPRNISPYAKDWEALVTSRKVVDNNPVMRWMISNCDIDRDRHDNIQPIKHGDKRAVAVHIDGVITSLMAAGRIVQLLNDGAIDFRTAEQIQADLEKSLASLNF